MVATPRERSSCNPGLYCAAHGRSRRWRFFAAQFLVIALLISGASAEAAFKRAIFQLAGLQQSARFSVEYDEEVTSNGLCSESLEFRETYHVGLNYAILHKNLAHGSIELDLGLSQNDSSKTTPYSLSDQSNTLSAEYRVDMRLIERSPYPVTLLAWQKTQQVDDPFVLPYDIDSFLFSLQTGVHKDPFPSEIRYQHRVSETSGSGHDSRRVVDDIHIESETLLGPGETDLKLDFDWISRAPSSGIKSESDSQRLYLKNETPFTLYDRDLKLYSRLLIGQRSGTSDSSSWSWDEDLNFRLGKALHGAFLTSWSVRETETLDQDKKFTQLWLEHRLFSSLTNRLEFTLSNLDYNNGSTDMVGMDYTVAYTKLLPWDSRIGLSYGLGIADTSQDVDEAIVGVEEERQADILGIYLLPYAVPGSVRVYDEYGVEYFADTDFHVDYDQPDHTTLLTFDAGDLSGAIFDGQTLRIEYRRYVNKNVEYRTTTNAIGGNLDLLDGRYKIYGNSRWTVQDLLGGSDDLVPLQNEWQGQVGFRANFERNKFSLHASRTDSDDSLNDRIQGYWQYRKADEDDTLTFRLNGSYNVTENKEADLYAEIQKVESGSLMFFADYRTRLAPWLTMTLRGSVGELKQGAVTHEEARSGVLMEARWYKFVLRSSVNYTWQFYDTYDRRIGRIYLALTRSF